MRSASKAVVVAGVIFLMVPLSLLRSYLFARSYNSIMEEASSQISEQEKTSFNQQWDTYEGEQGGNNIKALIQKLIANCNTNKDYPERLVDVYCSRPTEDGEAFNIPITEENAENAVNELSELRKQIESRHTYYVTIDYSASSSFVNRVIIKYNVDDESPSDLPNEN